MKRIIKAIIVDIDGTLADCSHRRHFVEARPKDWPGFYAAMANDGWNEMVMHVVGLLSGHLEVLVVTGRPDDHRDTTEQWLIDHPSFSYDELFMRKAGDFRPDTEVKREIYRREIAPHYEVVLVLDDRASVVDMWRAEGLQCWQVAEGDF